YLRSHRAQLFAILIAALLPAAGLLPIELSNGAIFLMWLAGAALVLFVCSDYAEGSELHEHAHPEHRPSPPADDRKPAEETHPTAATPTTPRR
ncbi:hypothetical protein LDC_0225, partial [sediment metagenome]